MHNCPARCLLPANRRASVIQTHRKCQKNAIYLDKTQLAKFPASPLCQATKRYKNKYKNRLCFSPVYAAVSEDLKHKQSVSLCFRFGTGWRLLPNCGGGRDTDVLACGSLHSDGGGVRVTGLESTAACPVLSSGPVPHLLLVSNAVTFTFGQ